MREEFHGPRVHQKHGGVFDAATATDGNIIGDSSFNRVLLFQIESGDDFVAFVRTFQDLLNKVRREKFSLRLDASAKLTRREFCVAIDPGAVIPIRLGLIDRTIIPLAEKGAPARALWDYAERD